MSWVDYDLTRLGTAEFEHLAQALCVAALGARVSMFGNGPDGGREATVEGRLSWDGASAQVDEGAVWNGYTVVQAKFKVRPTDVGSNLGWLKAELQKELSRWTDARYKRSKTRRPDNLLIITNVALSAVPDSGGVDTARAEIGRLIEEHDLSLKGWRLWHYDDLRALLDVHRSVRITYGGFLTSGDVLERMDGWLERQATDLGAALTGHAARDLLAQQWVRLGEAGDPLDHRLALGSVAVDLPAAVADAVDAERPDRTVAAAAYVLERGERIRDHGLDPGQPQHLLVVGGPGQGKSTLSQLVCQAYRVALLRSSTSLSPEATRVRTTLESGLTDIGLGIPNYLRWPIRVDLTDFGDVLSGAPETSLLRYLAGRVSRGGPYDITAGDLMAWLGKWPWLLVLDGIDEVTAPTVRESLTSAVSNFLIDVAGKQADVLIVVTTRPQGYAGEFGAHDYERLDLLPLDVTTALAYAERLTAARFDDDPDLQEKVLGRLRDAAGSPDSARLMTTPLQVTIMGLLLERRQRVPHDRYQLFDAYFQAIYARETNKPTAVGRLLADQRAHVEAIHEAVALALQQQAETHTEHEASLPASELHRRTTQRLVAEGHDPHPANTLADHLVQAATHRLVLLVPRGDEVGYEVRSLQEYMAARAITRGEQDDILDRLRSIITSAHWRNTWLFAAGRLFAEREGLRDAIISALQQVDNSDMLTMLAAPGAELATDLLADDLAITAPAYRRQLADQAIARLHSAPDNSWRTLARTLQTVADQDTIIRQKLFQQLQQSLAAGGGARAHAAVMIDAWRSDIGSVAARARQLHHARLTEPTDGLIANLGIHVIRSPRDMPPAHLRPAQRRNLQAYLTAALPELDPPDRAAVTLLLQELGGIYLFHSEDDLRQEPATVLGSALDELPEITVLDDALSRPRVADAVAGAVTSIPSADWHVTATSLIIIRYWYARRVATVA